jgi:hypothetical protein
MQRKTTLIQSASVVGFVLALSRFAGADVTLQNDNFQSGDVAAFEAGFGLNDVGASRFIAPDAGRQLLKAQVIFGPDSNPAGMMSTMTLKVYDDTAGGAAPGTELYSMDFQLVASSSALQEMDVSAGNVIVPQQFRVGLVFQHAGSPGLARDTTGTNHTAMNYIYDTTLGWQTAASFGVQGNWIFRAVVSGTATGGGADAGIPADASNVGATCTSNAQCNTGEFCDTTNHACTFECRTSSDCGNGTCNSLGMCVAGAGKSGGCCSADRGGQGSALLGLGVIAMILRRRRRAA